MTVPNVEDMIADNSESLPATTVYTIGHSNHPIERFVELLRQQQITAIGDVRFFPHSRFNGQFNRELLAASLKEAGISYVFLGDELGARPSEPTCYLDGTVDFHALGQSDRFKRGLDRVVTGAEKYRIALMCAEKEPLDCHRTILVCRHLKRRIGSIKHILADGAIEEHADTERRLMRKCTSERSLLDLESNRRDRLEDAYDKRGREIDYKQQQKDLS